MRLTLRTLLAYQDDVLAPGDAQELAKKVEESEFASKLVHRIRDSMRRLRLDAPKLTGKGMGQDPNTVAEYLDSTLPPERMPDFEKVCLESDVHLAEVACCHQVLTLVLREAAEVPPGTRERIYRISMSHRAVASSPSSVAEEDTATAAPEQTASGSVAGVPLATAAPAAGSGADSGAAHEPPMPASRPRPEVPDYLREGSRRRWWPVAATLLLTALLAGAVLMAMGPLNENHPLARLMGLGGSQVASGDDPAGGTSPDAGMGAETELRQPGTMVPADAGDAMGGGETARTATGGDGSTPGGLFPPPGSSDASGSNNSGTSSGGNSGTSADPPVPDTGPIGPDLTMPKNGTSGPFGTPLDGGTAEGGTTNSGTTGPAGGGTGPFATPVDPVPGATDGTAGSVPGAAGTTDSTGAVEPAPGGPAIDVGRYISDEQVLCRWDAETGEWLRLPPRAPLAAGNELTSLPTYRPQILLANGVQLLLDGATRIRLLAPLAEDTPRISVLYGRLSVFTVGRAGARIALQAPGLDGVATFVDADSAMAVEVTAIPVPGTDPESGKPQHMARLITTTGHMQWESGGETVVIDMNHARTCIEGIGAQNAPIEAIPAWVASKDLSDIDRKASETLETYLTLDRPVSLTLRERAEDRRAEVRSLSVRCLGCLEYFDELIGALADEGQRSSWAPQFDVLHEAVTWGPESAGKVKASLEKRRPAEAPIMYRMLWGYSPEDLERGQAARLIDYLEHNSLDVRVLAFENLRRITGATLLYRPEVPEARRRAPVQRWRERLKEGKVVYSHAPPETTTEEVPADADTPDAGPPPTITPPGTTVPPATPPTPPAPAPTGDGTPTPEPPALP